ncbi:MAG: membrane protein insertase YidC [Deltaproteobacteria bacterium]|jgi:YidC/Oxa1 family membrane protein insertase|nr:membrane protein insertase YidC [Deltaproteobacteria bacterium]
MDNKNLMLTIALCVAILVGWNHFADYMGWIAKPDPAQVAQQQKAAQQPGGGKGEAQAPAASAPPAPLAPGVFTPSEGRAVTVRTPLYTAVLYSGGGFLKSFELLRYRVGVAPGSASVNLVDAGTAATAPLGLLINGQPSWNTGRWALEGEDLTLAAGQQGSLRLIGEVDGLRVERELRFTAGTYLIAERLSLYAPGAATRTVRVAFTTGASPVSVGAGGTYDPMRIGWSLNGKFGEETSGSDLSSKGVSETGNYGWAAAMSNYFMNAILPADTAGLTLKGRMLNEVYRVALERPDTLVNPGEARVLELSYWCGPKDRVLLRDAPNNLDQSIDLGMFSIIAVALMRLLDFFHAYVGNWGIAIILLTIVIKILFWPLTAKSYKSMEQMKKLSPMMQKIREKHAKDKDTMNKEIMGLYKTYGVNPASGCVPILVQLPVFFGLYQALMTALELRHSSFITYLPGTDLLWLADLSAKDPTYITPLLMGATMFIQQRLTPAAGDPTQQKIMMLMPVVFTFLFLNFPSGLVVYWLVNNVLSIAQQWMMLRKVKT